MQEDETTAVYEDPVEQGEAHRKRKRPPMFDPQPNQVVLVTMQNTRPYWQQPGWEDKRCVDTSIYRISPWLNRTFRSSFGRYTQFSAQDDLFIIQYLSKTESKYGKTSRKYWDEMVEKAHSPQILDPFHFIDQSLSANIPILSSCGIPPPHGRIDTFATARSSTKSSTNTSPILRKWRRSWQSSLVPIRSSCKPRSELRCSGCQGRIPSCTRQPLHMLRMKVPTISEK